MVAARGVGDEAGFGGGAVLRPIRARRQDARPKAPASGGRLVEGSSYARKQDVTDRTGLNPVNAASTRSPSPKLLRGAPLGPN